MHAEAAAKLGVNRDTQIYAARALALAGDGKRAEKLATELNKHFPLDTIVAGATELPPVTISIIY